MNRNKYSFILIIFLSFCSLAYSQKIYYSSASNQQANPGTIYIIENSYCDVIDSIETDKYIESFCISSDDSLLYVMTIDQFPEESGIIPRGFSIFKYDTQGNYIEDLVLEYKTGHFPFHLVYKNADTLLVTGGLGYTVVDLINSNINHVPTNTLGVYPYDITNFEDQLFVLDVFPQNIVSLDFKKGELIDDPNWDYFPNINTSFSTSISALGDCSHPQDFVISTEFSENSDSFDEIHYISSPDFQTNVSCRIRSDFSVNIIRAIPYPLILDLDSSTDHCVSNDTIVSFTLCSDNTINLDGLHPYIEEYDDHIDSITIDIVDGPLAVTLDYNLGVLDKNIVNNKSLVLSNTGSSTIQDFTDAITSLSIENIPEDNISRIEIEFQLFSYIRQSLPATVVIELTQEDTYAGRDTILTFCSDVGVVDLNDYLDIAASSGTWPMGSLYNPQTSIAENIPYVVEGLLCPNDTAIYSLDVYPEALLQSEFISFCEGDSVLYRGEYYSQDVDLLDTISSLLSGCDSLYRMIEIRDSDTPLLSRIDTTICDGAMIDFQGQQLSASGMYRDTLLNSAACDSLIIELALSIHAPVTEIDIDTVLCEGEVLMVDNQIYTGNTQEVLILSNLQGCDSIQYVIDIEYKQLQEESIDTLLCAGEVFNFMGQTYTESVIDQIVVMDSQGCDSLIINLSLDFEQALFLPDQSFEIPLSNPTQVIVAYDLDYDSLTWFPEDGLSCADCLDPIVDLEQDATYQIEINPLGSCAEFINVQFFVIEEEKEESDFYLPNIISTSDSGNDKFYLQSATDNSMTYSMSIYDRWGSQVFISENINSNDASQGWDGSHYNGAELVQGVYVYKIVFEDGSVVSGDILVLR